MTLVAKKNTLIGKLKYKVFLYREKEKLEFNPNKNGRRRS
jgi:hypothetical protein